MIQRIKNWFEKRRRKQTLEIIKRVKQAYLNKHSKFMCICFYSVEDSFFFSYKNIVKRIPEFKPSTFGLVDVKEEREWWCMNDRESRIKAFDKLIEIYS